MTTVYNYDSETREFLSSNEANLDPLETELQGEDVFLLPANATWDEPPTAGENEVAMFGEDDQWSVVPDFRGTEYWDEDGVHNEIENIDETVPGDCTTEEPPDDNSLKVPHWNGSAWEEGGLVYYDKGPILSKADVDKVTSDQIIALGEHKAKTLKLIAGDGPCPEWDDFVTARAALVAEGDQFIIDNGLV
jgi:hypothetical protein